MRLLAAYIIVSGVLLCARPGYDVVSTWASLLGGAASSLALATSCFRKCYFTGLDGASHFSSESGYIGFTALLIWVLAGLAIVARRKQPQLCLLSIVTLWIVGAVFNTYWFAIRSL